MLQRDTAAPGVPVAEVNTADPNAKTATPSPDAKDDKATAPTFEGKDARAAKVQAAIKAENWTEACNELNGLWMRDIIDVIRIGQRDWNDDLLTLEKNVSAVPSIALTPR